MRVTETLTKLMKCQNSSYCRRSWHNVWQIQISLFGKKLTCIILDPVGAYLSFLQLIIIYGHSNILTIIRFKSYRKCQQVVWINYIIKLHCNTLILIYDSLLHEISYTPCTIPTNLLWVLYIHMQKSSRQDLILANSERSFNKVETRQCRILLEINNLD